MKDKVVIITGGTSGIGKAIAISFAKRQARVVISGRNVESLKSTEEELKKITSDVLTVQADVSIENDCVRLINETLNRFGSIDILINNAGISRYRPFAEATSEDWNAVLDVDLKGVFFCAQAVAPQMVAQGYGRIVNISSALGTGAAPHGTAGSPGGSSAYAAAKAGVIMLTKTLARELGPSGVTVNCVAPGTFLTPISASSRTPEQVKEQLEYRKKTVVLGRIGTLEEVVSAILFFASDDSSYVTGQTLCVDGGRSDRM